MKKLLITFLICLPTLCAADIFDDAKTLLAVRDGHVRKWQAPPRIAVVHDGRFDFAALNTVLAELDTATGLGLADDPIQTLDVAASGVTPFGGIDMRFSRKPGRLTGFLTTPNTPALQAEVFVFHLPKPAAAELMILSRSDGALARSYLQDKGPCYFAMKSRKDGVYYVSIFINPVAPEMFEACLYEEIAQAMGIVRDVQDTPYFTFDNLKGYKDRTYDLAMLSALYDPLVTSGDPVDGVVERFRDILTEQGIVPK